MKDIIITLIVVVVIASAIMYMRNEKKKGTRCIGCPNGGCCNCHCSK